MKKIESYKELSALISGQFRRGMLTNAFLSAGEWEKAIGEGCVAAYSRENSLLVCRQKESHSVLYFWLNEDLSFAMPPLSKNTVLEMPGREKDAALWSLGEAWERAGFRPLFTRQRMNCTMAGGTPCEQIASARESDLSTVRHLLNSNFSPVTGCIPDEDTLLEHIRSEGVLLYGDGQKALGLLHRVKDRAGWELRHLCVAEEGRGQGIGEKLVRAYHALCEGEKSRVWVRKDLAPALLIYSRCGYETDGMISKVYGL